jgi:hypothetical protein
MFTLGYFYIYGCAFAIGLLLIPARSVVFVLCTTAASIILILIHHVHFLMYVPTIVVLRYYLVRGTTRQNVLIGLAATICVTALFFAVQFYGSVRIPEAEFVRYLQGRMADASRTDLLNFNYIWYQPLSKELQDTWQRMPSNLLDVPVFALLIWLHAPLCRYFAELIRSLSDEFHRRVVVAAIALVSLGYLVMFAIVFDYSRWISNWAVCMFLILHAVKATPASRAVVPLATRATARPQDRAVRWDRYGDPAGGYCAAVLTLQPQSPDANVERALAAMTDMRLLKANHYGAEFRQIEPLRHLAAQHATVGFATRRSAFAGNDQHESQPVGMSAL